jgi:hypothetical protein
MLAPGNAPDADNNKKLLQPAGWSSSIFRVWAKGQLLLAMRNKKAGTSCISENAQLGHVLALLAGRVRCA